MMNAVSGLIFLVTLIGHCHFIPIHNEFQVTFQAIEKKLQTFMKPETVCLSNCRDEKERIECQCAYEPCTTGSCTDYELIERGLAKLNLTCSLSNTETCELLIRLNFAKKTTPATTVMPMALKPFLEHIQMLHQRHESRT